MSLRQVEEIARTLGAVSVPWNGAWNGGPAVSPAVASLPHGLTITLLSPRGADLARLASVWDRELARSSVKSAAPDAAEPAPEGELSTEPRIFISFARQDDAWARRLLSYLRKALPKHAAVVARNEGSPAVDTWSDRLGSGDEKTEVAVVVASPAALASEWLMERELPALLEKARDGSLRLAWILLEACAWEETPLARFKSLNDVGRPLGKLTGGARERVLLDIARNLEAARAPGREQRTSRATDTEAGPPDIEALASSAFRSDSSPANAASIAFLAEFHDRALLIGGDARADTLCDSIRELLERRGQSRLRVNAFVVPRGGSASNLSRELLELLECERYLISSDGSKFKHPSREAIARILTYGRASPNSRTTLVFNYRSPVNAIWADPDLQARYNYDAIYPQRDAAGIKVAI